MKRKGKRGKGAAERTDQKGTEGPGGKREKKHITLSSLTGGRENKKAKIKDHKKTRRKGEREKERRELLGGGEREKNKIRIVVGRASSRKTRSPSWKISGGGLNSKTQGSTKEVSNNHGQPERQTYYQTIILQQKQSRTERKKKKQERASHRQSEPGNS